ncbi:MAG: hypothetical protein ACRECF_12600, partial [Methyloceanibacter sp.]
QAGALAVYEEAVEIFRKNAAADPGNIMHQPDIEVVLQKIAAIRLADGDRDGALEAYEEALAIARRMAEAFPGKDVWRDDVTATRNKIEEIQRASGNTAEQ